VLAAHTEHVAAAADKEPSGPKLPAVQGVPEHTEEPDADEKVPATHWEQLEAPGEDKKVPNAHAAQDGATPPAQAHAPVVALRLNAEPPT
jgi:hypothetical protein